MPNRFYIAYGSNLNVAQMRYRCPDARIVGKAEIPDYELLFKGSKTGSYLTIEKKEGSRVPVAIWEVSPDDEASLDIYEGCPAFYYKTEMVLPVTSVQTGKTRKRRCFVYIMHEERLPGIPTRRYVQSCLDGYRNFGFDEDVLCEAVRKSLEVRHEV